MDNINSKEVVQAAFVNALLCVLVRRGLVSNNEADRAMRIITQEINSIKAEKVA